MNRNQRVTRSFVIQVADLVFYIDPYELTVSDGMKHVSTEISRDEIEILQAFAAQALSVVSPMAHSDVVYSTINGPQKISLIKKNSDYMLVINSQIQFTTKSEEIYHEALVHPAFGSLDRQVKSVLILGGGDGLAAKQIFKHYGDVSVTLVDFDKNITDLFTNDPVMKEINEGAMSKCDVLNADAFEFVKAEEFQYDIIICDFPDPDNKIFSKLYSTEIYENIKRLLAPGGVICVQSGSLVENSKCALCINKTLQAVGFNTIQYYTPTTYGELIYSMGHLYKEPKPLLIPGLKTMDQNYFDKAMRTIRPGLISKEEIEINTVENQAVLEYRLEELERVKR